jgi:hypothetical protein
MTFARVTSVLSTLLRSYICGTSETYNRRSTGRNQERMRGVGFIVVGGPEPKCGGDLMIMSCVLYSNNFLTIFIYIFSIHSALHFALADSGLSVGTVYVFEVSLLLVEEGIASNSRCILPLFLALGDYGLVTVGPLSTRPLSPLVLSFISPFSFSLDDVPISRS